MSTIKFENGMSVNFEGTPTQQDVDEVANKLGINVPGGETSKQRIGRLQTESSQAQDFANQQGSLGGMAGNFNDAFSRGVVQHTLKNPARFVGSTMRLPGDLYNQAQGGQASTKELPFGLGKSFQGEASENYGEIIEGKQPLRNALKPFVDVPLAGLETLGLVQGVGKVRSVLKERGAAKVAKDSFKTAVEIGRPKVDAKMEAKAFTEGRLGEQRLFKGAPMQVSKAEGKIGEALQPMVESGELTEKMSFPKQGEVIRTKLKDVNTGVRAYFSDPANTSGLTDAQIKIKLKAYLNAAKADNDVLFGRDTTIEKAYDTVIDEFLKYLSQQKGTGDIKVLDTRIAFDNFIKGKLPQVFKHAYTGVLSPTDNAKIQAVRDARTAANNLLSDILPANNPYKAALKTETGLIQALENISTKVGGITQTGKLQSFFKTPLGRATEIGGAVGIGTGAYQTTKRILGF